MKRLRWLHVIWSLLACAALAQPLPIVLSAGQLSVTVSHPQDRESDLRELGRQSLPWKWDTHFPRQSGVMHFTFNFQLEQTLVEQIKGDGKGLGLSSILMGNRYRYRVNGAPWQQVGWDEPNTQYRTAPRWQLLAAQHLQPGANILELDIRAEPASHAGLSRIEISDASASLAAHDRTSNQRMGLALMSGTLSALICMMSLAIWWKSREKSFLIVSIAQACFALWQIDFFVDYPPVPTWVFNAVRSVLYVYFAGLMCWVSVLLISRPAPWLNRAIKIYLWTALPTLLAGAILRDYRIFELFWAPASVLLVAVSVMRFTLASWKKSDGTMRVNALLTGVVVIFGLYDLIVAFSPAGFGEANLVNYSFLLSNFAVGMMLARRYWNMQSRLLKLGYQKNLEVKQATMLERQRLIQDIHDSVGSQLVGLLSLVNASAPQNVLRTHTFEVLDELRMALDAIENVDGDLAVVLASMRHRLQPRLDAANIRLIWDVEALPRFAQLGPQHIQHIQRILLEIFTNIIQHAKATQVLFTARSESSNLSESSAPELTPAPSRMIRISIDDDGVGMSDSSTRGRGLDNMQRRAAMLGATLAVTARKPRGTAAQLHIPVN